MKYILFEKINYYRFLKEYMYSFFEQDNLKRLSKLNELKDYKYLLTTNNLKLRKLHYDINVCRINIKNLYTSYDYGQGYFYQSIPDVKITGYRNTTLRVEKLNLKNVLKNKSVLDIGSNTGAILFNLRNNIKSGIGVENNTHLIKISNLIKSYLETDKISFIEKSFENYKTTLKFDIVLSFANHKTFDGNTKQTFFEYFQKIRSLINDNGTLIFESHPPEIETEAQYNDVLKNIRLFFKIKEIPNVVLPGFLDKNRKYLICLPKKKY